MEREVYGESKLAIQYFKIVETKLPSALTDDIKKTVKTNEFFKGSTAVCLLVSWALSLYVVSIVVWNK